MGKLNKTLNIYQGIGILVSTLLGSGIFIVPAIVSTIAGANSLISWVGIIICVLPIAITFGELGALYPHSNGSSFFTEKAFGEKNR